MLSCYQQSCQNRPETYRAQRYAKFFSSVPHLTKSYHILPHPTASYCILPVGVSFSALRAEKEQITSGKGVDNSGGDIVPFVSVMAGWTVCRNGRTDNLSAAMAGDANGILVDIYDVGFAGKG